MKKLFFFQLKLTWWWSLEWNIVNIAISLEFISANSWQMFTCNSFTIRNLSLILLKFSRALSKHANSTKFIIIEPEPLTYSGTAQNSCDYVIFFFKKRFFRLLYLTDRTTLDQTFFCVRLGWNGRFKPIKLIIYYSNF